MDGLDDLVLLPGDNHYPAKFSEASIKFFSHFQQVQYSLLQPWDVAVVAPIKKI